MRLRSSAGAVRVLVVCCAVGAAAMVTPCGAALAAPAPGAGAGAASRAPQDRGPKWMSVFLGPGLSFGFFYPADVNSYMEAWVDRQGTVVSQSGFTGMFLNLVPRVTFEFLPLPYLGIQAVGEVGWGPKILSVSGGDSEFFNFMRYSGGGGVNGYLPLKQGSMALLAGGAVLYHHMDFDGYAKGTVGFRGKLGLRIYNRRFTPEIVVAFDWARAELDRGDPHDPARSRGPAALNYTGVLIGANFYFNLTPKD